MAVNRLAITHFRNIKNLSLRLNEGVNLITGPNGSGKTSILECVYLLGRARSFVSNKNTSLVQRGEKFCTVFGEVKNGHECLMVPIGVTRTLDGKQQIKIGGDRVFSSAPLAQLLPIQVINPNAFRLLEGGPKSRRQFIDWGVFHVEHSFINSWKRLARCLQQRNNMLRKGAVDRRLIQSWDKEFIENSLLITCQRRKYIERLEPLFSQLLARVSSIEKVSLTFYPGWDESIGLESVLADAFERDQKEGFTRYGPQRADLKVKHMGLNAVETLSRGQQKLVVSALKIAQGHLYVESNNRQCIYLVDDLAAELDANHRESLSNLLFELNCQLLMTSVDEEPFADYWRRGNISLFHVEHGNLVE